LLKDENLVASWQQFFEEHCKSQLETLALSYPNKRSLVLDYWKVDEVDDTLADLLLKQPYKAFFNAEEALKTIDVSLEHKMDLHFRVINLPETNKIIIRNIRANHLGTLVAVDGLVKKRT